MVSILGYSSKEELMAIDIKTQLYFHEDDRKKVKLKEKNAKIGVYRMKKKDGSEIWVEDHGWLTLDKETNLLFHEGIMRDVTQRIKDQEALRKSEAIQNKMVSNIGDVIVIIDQNGINRFKSANIEKWFGWKPEELVGKSTWDNMHPDDLLTSQKIVAEISKVPDSVVTTELRYKRKDGKYVWIKITLTNLLLDPDIQGILGNYHDITFRKNYETEIVRAKLQAEESEANLVEAQRISKTGSWVWDLEINRVTWSKEMFRIYDISPENFNNNPEVLIKKLHPDDLLAFSKSMNANLKKGDAPNLEYRVIHADGSIHYIEAVGRTEYNELGKPIKNVGTARDITESKKNKLELINAKERAQESEFKVRSMFENSLTGFLYFTPEGDILEVNPAFSKIMGSPSIEDTKSINILTFEPLVKVGFTDDAKKCLKSKQIISNEKQYATKWGKKVFVKYFLIPITIKNKTVGIWANFHDITDLWETQCQLINAKQLVEESELKYRLIAENTSDGILVLGADSKIQYASPAYLKQLGYTSQSDIPKDAANIYNVIHPDDRDELFSSIYNAIENKKSDLKYSFRTKHTNGHYIWREDHAQFQYDENRNCTATYVVCRDITAQKNILNELISSETKYREMADSLPVGVFETDLNGTITFVNQTVINWLGYSADEFKNKANILNFVVDEEREMAMERSQRIITENIALNSEYTLKRKSGDTFPVIVSSTPLIQNKKIMGVRGTVVDITKRKKAENERETLLSRVTNSLEETAKAKNILNEIMERVSDGFIAFDNTFNYTYVNSFGAQLLNRKPEELIGKNYWEEYPEAKGTPFANAYVKAFETQEPIFFEEHYIQWNRWFSNRIYPSKDGITIFFSDITTHKLEESIIKAYNTISDFSFHATLDQLLQKTLDEIEKLTNSSIGFIHFVDSDQVTLKLQMWSTNTLAKMCTAEAKGSHYSIDKAGIWVDCVRSRTPIIHNNYAAEPHKKGLPEGNAPIIRELVIPIFRNEKIVAILSVGNKETDYDQTDIQTVTKLANLAWEITERNQAEQALTHSYELMNYIIEHMQGGVAVFDNSMNYTYVSQRYLDEYKITENSIIGKNHYEVSPEIPERWKVIHQKALAGEVCNSEKDIFKRADGIVEWTRWECRPWHTAQGTIGGIVLYTEVITERIVMEEALRESEHQLKSLFENAADAIFIAETSTGIILDCNKAAEQLLKKPIQAIVGQHQSTLYPVEKKDLGKKTFLKHVKETKESFKVTPIENLVVCSDGSTIPVEGLASPVIFKGKECLMGTFRNLTERKQAEAKVRELAGQMNVFLATTSDGFFKLSNKGTIVEATKKMAQITGYTPHELTNLPLSTIELKETSEQIEAHMKGIIEQGYGIFETQYRTKYGEKVDIEISTSYWPEKEEFLAFARDISERKRAEQELINTKKQLQKAQKMAQVGNWELDVATNKIWASDEAFTIYGIPNSDQYLPHKLVQSCPLPEYRPLLDKALLELITKNLTYDLEFQITRYDNQEIRSIRSLAELIIDEKGNPVKVIGVIQDITGQKKLENELRVLSNAIEQNPASIVISDTHGTIEYVNPKFTQSTGYSFSEAIGKNTRILKTGVTPMEDYVDLWTTISSGKIWQGEFCNQKKDGTQYWESVLISPVFSTYGKITHYVAVKEDITGKKETDRKIMSAVIEGEERERNRFSRELHDGLGPLLSSIKLYFQWISKMEDPEKKLFLTGKGNHNIDEAILTLREISNNLSPQSLNTFGLVLAIRNYIEGLNQVSDIQIDLQSNIEIRFNKNIEIALYRVVLELINNCLKHAEAKEIRINLHYIEFAQLIRLTYTDNGKGFNLDKTKGKSKGRGLLNIQYRISSLNGKITMKSAPGKGLEVTIEVPVLIEK